MYSIVKIKIEMQCKFDYHKTSIKDRMENMKLLINGYITRESKAYCLIIPKELNIIFTDYYGCYECHIWGWDKEIDILKSLDLLSGKCESYWVHQAT